MIVTGPVPRSLLLHTYIIHTWPVVYFPHSPNSKVTTMRCQAAAQQPVSTLLPSHRTLGYLKLSKSPFPNIDPCDRCHTELRCLYPTIHHPCSLLHSMSLDRELLVSPSSHSFISGMMTCTVQNIPPDNYTSRTKD